MKKTIKRLMAIVVLLCLLLCSIVYVENITKAKSTYARDLSYKTFFDNAEEYDVLFLGTSHVMYGINPLEIWDEYGITSFNWGSATCTIPSIYWKLMNILEYGTPRLVVIDCFRATWIEKTYNTYRMHEAFDAFPLSYTKYQAVNDLMKGEIRKEDGAVYSDTDRYSILFPIYAYHSRWAELTEKDFQNTYLDTKGCEFEINVADPIDISNTTEKAEVSKDMQGVVYLKKIIEECEGRNIPILLAYLPYPTDETWKKEANMIQDIADEYGVNYLNFTNMDVVNYATDYADPDSHMNVAGGKKVSSYFGQYISENYDIPDRRNDEAYQGWSADYQSYVDYKLANIKNQTSIETELMLLAADDSFSCCVYIKEGSEVLENEKVVNLLMNIMDTKEAGNIEKARADGSSYFMLHDSVSRYSAECLNGELSRETSFGKVVYTSDSNPSRSNGSALLRSSAPDSSFSGGCGSPHLYIEDMEKDLLDGDWNNEGSTETEPDVRVFVIDNRTGETAYDSMWDYQVTEDAVIRK